MTGFQNEDNIIDYLNTTSFDDLNTIHQKFILDINNAKKPNKIFAKKYAGANKADIGVTIDEEEFFFSIKKGSGNSVHQEPLEEFISYLKKEVEDDEDFFNSLRLFIWGDETLDGTGNKSNRIDAPKFKKKYPNEVLKIQNYLDKHKDVLIDRFVISGVKSSKSADYLWYGESIDGIMISKNDMLTIINSSTKKPISLGILTFQAWNRNIKPDGKSEHKRGVIQLKWGTLKNDILDFYDTK
ncbi:hypothetical protein [Empedobacter stercoris]|uniref:hypothetical protein n=1 Tax=Empedobacter stercoris TaxID=1628248 RepID=UPI0039E892C7